jgi:tRNA threonylcarbamoyladenosine biosynthesis protein TsaB
MRLLALDTASGQCSAALFIDGQLLLREQATAREHARLILPMVQSLLAEAGCTLGSLQAIAFGRGPGSFTGVRIAASVTQGLAFAADLPVLPVSDLRALALQAADLEPTASVPLLACMDARMHEVYWSLHAPAQQGVVSDAAEHVSAPATLLEFLAGQATGGQQILAAGCGLAAYFRDNAAFGVSALRQLPQAEPHAREIARLAVADFAAGLALPAEAAVPVYVRDQVVQTPRA